MDNVSQMANFSTITTAIALLISIASFLYTIRRNIGTDTKKIWDALNNNTTEIALLKKQGDLFWGLVEQQMARALIRPTHIELDKLLEKLVKGEELPKAQELQLQQMLHDAVIDKKETAGVRGVAAIILAIRLAKQKAAQEVAQN